MDGTHVALGGVGTAAIAQVLMWLTHWPIQPLDQNTATAIAGLMIAFIGGGGLAYFNRTKQPEQSK